MRPAAFVLVSLGVLVACESDNVVTPVTVQWMDWPAQVDAAQPFRTRLVVWGVCAVNPRFRPGARADESAVTFSPYFLVDDDNDILCVGRASESFTITALDTAGMAPGLAATFGRTYEMRAAVQGLARVDPIRTFGEVLVGPPGTDPERRNAAGTVSLEVDSAGCARVRPLGLYSSDGALVLENQADTAGLSFAFVRGHIHHATTPICGETWVFNLVSRD